MNRKYCTGEAYSHSMIGRLGIELISEKPDLVEARMPVNDSTSQPFGVLCGGASLAFAEILAGYASYLTLPDGFIPVGSSVSGNHVSSVKKAPDTYVYAYASPLHIGRSTHIWNVDIKTEDGRLVSSVRVTNFIVRDKSETWK